MLADRLRTSAILITVSVALMVMDAFLVYRGAEGIWLVPLLMFFALGTAWEMATILDTGGHELRPGMSVLATLLICSLSLVPMLWVFSPTDYPDDCPIGRVGWIVLGGVAAMFFILLAEMRYYGVKSPDSETQDGEDGPGMTIRRTCNATFVSLYVGLPMAMLVGLRTMHAEETSGRFGLAALITMMIVTKLSDAGAYFTGKAMGRNKLIERLSPGKTIEGSIGGILASTLGAYLCLQFLFPWICPADIIVSSGTESAGSTSFVDASVSAGTTAHTGTLAHPLWGAVFLGPALAISGMIGDLAESLIKRDAGVKDSGNLLPGLGGVWDVSDSVLGASIPAFFCFAAGVGGP